MLSRLEGRVLAHYDSAIELRCLPFTFTINTPLVARFPIGSEVCVYTELLLRDEKPVLFGFDSITQKQAFVELLKIPSLGPKIAFEILRRPLADFLAACQRQDKAFLSQIPGIGPKMAARIFAEIVLERFPLQATVPSGVAQWQQQASAVLLNLGFDAASIHKALGQCLSTSLDALIKEALQKLGEQRA